MTSVIMCDRQFNICSRFTHYTGYQLSRQSNRLLTDVSQVRTLYTQRPDDSNWLKSRKSTSCMRKSVNCSELGTQYISGTGKVVGANIKNKFSSVQTSIYGYVRTLAKVWCKLFSMLPEEKTIYNITLLTVQVQ